MMDYMHHFHVVYNIVQREDKNHFEFLLWLDIF